MESKAGMEERHRMLTKPPSNEEFKTKQVLDVLIEFIIKYIPKMYGIHKIRSILAANPGTESDSCDDRVRLSLRGLRY